MQRVKGSEMSHKSDIERARDKVGKHPEQKPIPKRENTPQDGKPIESERTQNAVKGKKRDS
jgi:hypothetical protein